MFKGSKAVGGLPHLTQEGRPGQPTWHPLPILLSKFLTAHVQNFHNKHVELRISTRNWDWGILLWNFFKYIWDPNDHVSTVWISHIMFPSMSFLLTKNGLCIWISAYPFVENNFFSNLPQLWWIWDFAHMYLTRVRTRMWSPTSHI
jgi:hypothetical protein